MSEVSELENQKKQYQELINLRDAILALNNNPYFKKAILESYCLNECARYVGVSGDPALRKEDRKLALEMAKGCQHLKRWLNVQIQMGDKAEKDIEEIDKLIANLDK